MSDRDCLIVALFLMLVLALQKKGKSMVLSRSGDLLGERGCAHTAVAVCTVFADIGTSVLKSTWS